MRHLVKKASLGQEKLQIVKFEIFDKLWLSDAILAKWRYFGQVTLFGPIGVFLPMGVLNKWRLSSLVMQWPSDVFFAKSRYFGQEKFLAKRL